MDLEEINFDGLVGPTHNYAGLSLGNLAATANAGKLSSPRDAALEGLAKMRANLALGLRQGFFVPLPRPGEQFIAALGLRDAAEPALTAAAWSASAMWAANAATVSPAPDTRDGRCHLTVANLVTMPHRSQEWPDTLRQLRTAFADSQHFAVHPPVPPCFGDEGAANHMRLGRAHGEPGVEIFVFGRSGGAFPARQHEQASQAVARLHQLDPARVVFIEQNPEAIAAGAFHNDVVAVANETVLLVHEKAFARPEPAFDLIRAHVPEAQILMVPDAVVPLAEAVRSYLFNAQLVTLPDGAMALIVPLEAWHSAPVRSWLGAVLAGNGPIRRVVPVDVRQSMANGGGPACLRLRVVANPQTVDPRFLLDEARADRIERVIRRFWPKQIEPGQIGDARLAKEVIAARRELLAELDLEALA